MLREQQTVQPIVHLQPCRTFLEVEQPASDFLLRLSKSGYPALHEADGGAWKLEAKRNIAADLGEKLADLVERGSVVVMNPTLNICALQGRLARDPELRQTNTGKQAATFTLAVDRGRAGTQTGRARQTGYPSSRGRRPRSSPTSGCTRARW